MRIRPEWLFLILSAYLHECQARYATVSQSAVTVQSCNFSAFINWNLWCRPPSAITELLVQTKEKFSASNVMRCLYRNNVRFTEFCRFCISRRCFLFLVQNKGQSNLEKGDIAIAIARLISHNVICKRNLIDIFYHIRQMAACVAKLVPEVHLGYPFGGRGGRRESSIVSFNFKERCWFPIGSPLLPLR